MEVLSTTEKERDRVVKREVYAGYGVSEYWAVDPCCKTIEVMVLSGHNYGPGRVLGAGDALKSDVLPGLELDVESVFAGVWERGSCEDG